MYSHPNAQYPVALNAATASQLVAVAICRELGSTPPEWIELIPAGTFSGRDSRTWINDNPDAVVAAFVANRAPLPIDIEHSTQHTVKGCRGRACSCSGLD